MPPAAKHAQRAFECGLRPERFDGHVHALALGQAPDLFDRIRLGVVDDDVSAHALRHFRAHRIGFDRDDESRALELGARRRAQANRPLRKNRYGVADLHLAAFRSGNSRGGNVRQQDDLLVAQVVRNLRQVRLRVRHQKVLRLRAVDGVSEFPAADRSAALRPVAAQAVIALTARSDRPDQDALADRVTVSPTPSS